MMNADTTFDASGAARERPPSAAEALNLGTEAGATGKSRNIRLCLALIYYFSICDTALKLVPLRLAIILRYLPELILYFLVFILLTKRVRIKSFPLFWPLVICAVSMTISGILNSCPVFDVLGDFRSYFRFSALCYILWRTTITPRRIEQFVDGFLRLTIVEIVIGGIELIGGERARVFFAPAIDWQSGAPKVLLNTGADQGTWLSGTLSNYNHYGMFMVISCSLAILMCLRKKTLYYLAISITSGLAVVLSLSRHALLLLVVAMVVIGIFHWRRLRIVAGIRWTAGIVAAGCIVVALSGGTKSIVVQRIASIGDPATVSGDPRADMRMYMTLILPPRFLAAYPFFGQGPIPASETVPADSDDQNVGPRMRAAPELSGYVTHFLGDVVWVMVLGLYGLCGVAALFYVFWTIMKLAAKVRKEADNAAVKAIAEACILAVVLFLLCGFFSEEIIARDTIPVFWALSGMVLSLATNPLPGSAEPVELNSLPSESRS